MAGLPTPIVAVVTGEGGSGGALALGVADRVLMLEHAIYSVISPEGCAAILWEDASRAKDAAEVLRITAPDLLKLGVIDGIIPEPPGGAHRNWAAAARAIQSVVAAAFGELVPALADRARPAALREVPPHGDLRGDLGHPANLRSTWNADARETARRSSRRGVRSGRRVSGRCPAIHSCGNPSGVRVGSSPGVFDRP